MKKKLIFTSILILFPFLLSVQAAVNDLPQVVRETLDRELDDYRFRSSRQATENGKTVYRIEARGRMSRKLRMTVGEDGSLIKKIYENQFRIVDNRLMKEERLFWIQSIHTPKAGDPESAPKGLLESLSNISYAGGNILTFDLHGVKPDGSGFTKEAGDFYQKMIDRLIYTKIGCYCRVFGQNTSQDSTIRLKVVRTVAKYFQKQNQFIFEINGPDAASLAQEFKKIAPGLLVAAPGADIGVVDSVRQETQGKPALTIGDMPSGNDRNRHFLLNNNPENFKALDGRNTEDVERKPWTPDNSSLSEDERREGFNALFDGKTTNGWTSGGSGFLVKNGELQRRPGSGGMRTIKRFADFVLRFDYRIVKNGNSGVQVHCPRSNRYSKVGFEVQILGDHGRSANKNSTGSIYNVVAPTANASKPSGEWNSMEIACKGSSVRVILNGQKVQDIDFDDYDELKYRLRDGFIYLTDHGASVAYRSIRIKEL